MSNLDRKYIQQLMLKNSDRISLYDPDGIFICMHKK